MADELKVTSSSKDTVDVVGLNDIKADLTLKLPQPLKTDATETVTVKPLKADLGTTNRLQIDPLKTDSAVSLDLKPAVVDLCLTLNVGKLPNVCIRQPYRHHVGFTLWGAEIWGFTFSGEQETVIEEQRPQPMLALGPAAPRPVARPTTHEQSGLRIRLGP